MASRSLPKLLQSSAARRVPSVPQQRALSSIRQQASSAAARAGNATASASVRKTAVQAAGSVAARRYAHTGEKSEYMVSHAIQFVVMVAELHGGGHSALASLPLSLYHSTLQHTPANTSPSLPSSPAETPSTRQWTKKWLEIPTSLFSVKKSVNTMVPTRCAESL